VHSFQIYPNCHTFASGSQTKLDYEKKKRGAWESVPRHKHIPTLKLQNVSPNTPTWTSIEMEIEHFQILEQDFKTKPYPKWVSFF